MTKQFTAAEAGIEIATIQMHLEREARKYQAALKLNLEGQTNVAMMRSMLAIQDQDELIPEDLSLAIQMLMGIVETANKLQETV